MLYIKEFSLHKGCRAIYGFTGCTMHILAGIVVKIECNMRSTYSATTWVYVNCDVDKSQNAFKYVYISSNSGFWKVYYSFSSQSNCIQYKKNV